MSRQPCETCGCPGHERDAIDVYVNGEKVRAHVNRANRRQQRRDDDGTQGPA